MKIANVSGRSALVTPTGVIDVEKASKGRFGPNPQAIYEDWNEFCAWAQTLGAEPVEPLDVDDLGPPAPDPRQVFAVALNYRDHAAEAGRDVPTELSIFTKFPTSFTGPGGEIALPAGGTSDWEIELVAVIGRRAERVEPEQAWDFVAGLTVGQDISERGTQLRGARPQFSLAKSFPGFSPTGPWLVTPDELDDPGDLELGCLLNGEQMQRARTSEQIFSLPQLVSRLSYVTPLLPGDVIFTGTPAGVGVTRSPQRFLAPGDELISYIAGIGEMRHRFVAGPPIQ